jgi:hypothetical protein
MILKRNTLKSYDWSYVTTDYITVKSIFIMVIKMIKILVNVIMLYQLLSRPIFKNIKILFLIFTREWLLIFTSSNLLFCHNKITN